MPTLIMHIAESGSQIVSLPKTGEPGLSLVGHAWYSIVDDGGNEKSFGFAPRADHEGENGIFDPNAGYEQPFFNDVPGDIYSNDSTNYLPSDKGKVTTLSVQISDEQYSALLQFGTDPEKYGFKLTYNGVTNSCVDFTWAALAQIGVTPYVSHNGHLLPVSNIQEASTVLHNDFGDVVITVRGAGNTLSYVWEKLTGEPPADWVLQKASSILQWGVNFWDSYRELVAKLDSTGDNYRKYLAAKAASAAQISPIVLDLNGNGVETTALAASAVHFDLDANGFAERTGWVAPTDGLLVRDINGNGVIDDGTELFGTATILPDGTKAASGFAALAALDSNGDGKIDASDPVYAQLAVWRDLNGDGKTDQGELQSIADAGVTSLNTSATANNTTVASGATDWLDGTFTKSDGSTGVMSDMLFERNPSDTVALTTVDVPDDIAALPDISGMGDVASLHQVMAQDQTGSLAALVEGFSNAGTWVAERALAEQILIQWAGAQDADARYGSNFSTGTTVDGRAVRAMEVFFGESITVKTGCWRQFEDVWEGLVDSATAILVAQTSASGPLSLVTQDETTGAWDFSVVSQLYASWLQVDPTACCESLTGFLRAAQSMGAMTQADVDAMKATVIGTSSLAWMVFANNGVRMLSEAQALADSAGVTVFAEGADGGESIPTMPSLMSFRGGDGDDTIVVGGDNTQWVSGGAGNDTLTDVARYVYGMGDGHDVVTLDGNANTKIVLVGVSRETLAAKGVMRKDGDDLILTFSGTDSVTFKDWFRLQTFIDGPPLRLWAGQLILVDGGIETTLSTTDIDGMGACLIGTDGDDTLQAWSSGGTILYGEAGNDTLNGSAYADRLYGGDGDDHLNGNGGADIIDGGAGNDIIVGGLYYQNEATAIGGAGDDTITYCGTVIFRPGDGHDTVNVSTGHASTLVLDGFDMSVLERPNAVRRSGNDLVLTLGTDSVTFPSWFCSSPTRVATGAQVKVQDASGESVLYSMSQMDALAAIIWGTDVAEALSLASSPSGGVLHGLAGNDTLTGSSYADSLYGDDGDDHLNGNGGADRLDGGAGNDIISGGVSTGSGETAIGGTGNDTIQYCTNVVFRPGDGTDTVYMVRGGVLKLMGYAVDALTGGQTVRQSGDDLVLALGADKMTLKGWFVKSGTTRYNAGSILLDDLAGNTLTLTTAQVDALAAIVTGTDGADTITMRTDFAATVHGGAGNDTIRGSYLADTLYGDDGADTIIGNGGADTMCGGAGNDIIQGSLSGAIAIGGAGNDTISNVSFVQYALGDGNDSVTFSSSSVLRLYGVTHQSLVFTRSGSYDLKMTMPDGGSIVLTNFYNGTSCRPTSVVFYDTTDMSSAAQVASWATADLLAAATQGTGYGLAGSDDVLAATLESGTSIVAAQALASGDTDAASTAQEALANVAALATGDQAQAGADAVLLNGGHQADTDVTWCLADVSRDTTGLFSAQAGSDIEALVRGACEAWERVSGLHFTEVADDGSADIRIGFGDFDTATTGVIGYTSATQTADGSFAKGAIVRIEDTSETSTSTDATGELVYDGTGASVEQVLEHEIGHALGLASDADPNSVMCWKLTDQNRTLDATDVAGAQELYGAPTGAAVDPRADAATLADMLGGEVGMSSAFATYLAAQDETLGLGTANAPTSDASTGVSASVQAAANLLTQVLAQTSTPAADTTQAVQGVQQENPLLLAVSKAA